MAGVREERGGVLPGPASGKRSIAVLVMALVAVLAAIVVIWNSSRRPARLPAVIENVAPATALPTAEQAPAVNSAGTDESAATARRQAALARVIDDGRPDLTACYQRALIRDESLVYGEVTVRASIAPSGRVDTVNVVGPPAFRAMQPCLKTAISRWDFPTAPEPYTTEFPLVLQGNQ